MELNETQKKIIEQEYFNKKTMKEIASLLEIPYIAIKKYAAEKSLRQKRQNELQKKLVYFLENCFSKKQIAAELNIPRDKVKTLYEKYNIKVSFRDINRINKEKQVLKEYQQVRMSISEMVKVTKYSYHFIAEVYKKNELQNINHQKRKFEKLDFQSYNEILSILRTTTEPLSKIAEKYNVSRQRIHQIQKTNNILRP